MILFKNKNNEKSLLFCIFILIIKIEALKSLYRLFFYHLDEKYNLLITLNFKN